MSAPVTSAEFIERVRQSGLCTDSHLDRYLNRQPAAADAHAEPISDEMVRSGLLTDFQAREILGARHPNFFIAGKYRILELLGRGGMSSVFLCEHVRMRRLVAVKVLPQECENDPEMLARFEREAQAVAAFDHPNVVHAYDIDQADGRHFLVMEFVDGVDLQSFVASGGRMTPERAAWCVAQTARGLHHAWLAGWVHRDIKPGNLLIDRGGGIKILDLGLARIFNSTSARVTAMFKDGCILGTADYLSPEQASGDHDTDIRADIYSLGATFYFLLTGKAPFEDGNVGQKLLWHRTLHPLPVRVCRPEVPEAMAAILGRMLEKDPRHRQATPGEVAEALRPFCTPPPPPPDATQMPAWSPASAERIRACQAPNEQEAPRTLPLAVKSDLRQTGKIVKPTELRAPDTRPAKMVVVPIWAAAAFVLVLAMLVGWTVYREVNPRVQRVVDAARPALTQPIPAGQAEHHIDDFACVELTVGAAEHNRGVFLYPSTTTDAKGFFVLIDREAIERGRFDATEPARLEPEFVGKRLRVVGRIMRRDDDDDANTYRGGAPYIKVFDPKQIQILGDAGSP